MPNYAVHNHVRAPHKVHWTPGGMCVKWNYRGYEISLAADGENTCVFSAGYAGVLFSTPGTTLESVLLAKQFVDTLHHSGC